MPREEKMAVSEGPCGSFRFQVTPSVKVGWIHLERKRPWPSCVNPETGNQWSHDMKEKIMEIIHKLPFRVSSVESVGKVNDDSSLRLALGGILRKIKSSSFSNQELHYTWIDQTNSMPICRDWMPWWWYAEWQLYFSCLICFRWLPEQVGWRDCGNSTCHQWWTSGSCFGPRLGTLSRHVGYARAADGGNDFGKFFGTCFAVLKKFLISISKHISIKKTTTS